MNSFNVNPSCLKFQGALLTLCAASAFLFAASGALAETEFGTSHKRYLSGHDLIRVLTQKFPHFDPGNSECIALSGNNRRVIGEPMPFTGEPLIKSPSPGFVRWYTNCVSSLATDTLTRGDFSAEVARYAGTEALALLPGGGSSLRPETPWKSLPAQFHARAVGHLITELIGPGLVKDEARLVTRIQASLLDLAPESSLRDALVRAILMVSMNEAFLSY